MVPPVDESFPSTRWSRILASASGGSRALMRAFENLATSYWRPVYAYVRALTDKPEEEAMDLTQDFFLWVLEHDFLGRADPDRGRFRALMKVSLKNFLTDHERKRRTLKRGGQLTFLPIHGQDGGAPKLDLPAPEDQTPEEALDEAWRVEVIEKATQRLEAELVGQNKKVYFEVFRDYFLSEEDLKYSEVAERYDITTTDVSNYLMLAKKLYRLNLRSVVLETVQSPEDLEHELAWLFDKA